MKLRCLECGTINNSDISNISCFECGHDFSTGGFVKVSSDEAKSEKVVRGRDNPQYSHDYKHIHDKKSFMLGHIIFLIIHSLCIIFFGIIFLIFTIPSHLIFWVISNK